MVMTDILFYKLVKYEKIQEWWCQIFNDDWIYKTLSKRRGYCWFENVMDGQVVEWKISDIERIGDMQIENWLDSVNVSPEGNLMYLEIPDKTDFKNTIQGQKTYSYKGIPFVNNMNLILEQDIDPELRNKLLIITGVGTEAGISLKRNKGRPRFARELKGESNEIL